MAERSTRHFRAIVLALTCLSMTACPNERTHPNSPDVGWLDTPIEDDTPGPVDTTLEDIEQIDVNSPLDTSPQDSGTPDGLSDTIPADTGLSDSQSEDTTLADSASDVAAGNCESFETSIQPIFNQQCVGCHNTFSAEPALDLTATGSINSLVQATSLVDESLILVVPGDSAGSYLINKLGPNPTHGLPMPIIGPGAGPGLDSPLISSIAAWIDAGASTEPYNCQGEDAGITDTETGVDTEEADVDDDVSDEGPSDAGEDVEQDVIQDVDEDVDEDADQDIEDDTPEDAQEDVAEDIEEDIPLPPCDPALEIAPVSAIMGTYTFVSLSVTGGSGDYDLSIVTNNSGAQLGAQGLSYLSGPNPGIDVIEVTDSMCEGVDQISIEIVTDPVLSPPQTVLSAGSCLALTATGGSGSFTYEILSVTPLGTLGQDGLYTAGDTPGEDVIRVTDTVTNHYAQALIIISEAATFKFEASHYWLPVGGDVDFSFEIGTGSPQLSAQGNGGVTIEGTKLTALSAGSLTLTAQESSLSCPGDLEGGLTATTIVTMVESLHLPSLQWGMSYGHDYAAINPGDIDGDGYSDAVVSDGGASFEGAFAGLVNVYRGGPDGLDPEPALRLTAPATSGLFGRSLEYADLTGDGVLDLIVGAPGQSPMGNESGAVYVYPGQDGGLFDPLQVITLPGTVLARFGTSLATCDFNGDGFSDLAVGAPHATSTSPWVVSRGYTALFLGGEDGIKPYPDETLWAVLPAGVNGAWGGVEQTRAGQTLAAGDYDGDGLCDLVVGTDSQVEIPEAPLYEGGLLMLHRGDANVGLLGTPSRHWRTLYPPGFGDDMILADLNGDAASELIVGHRHTDWATGKESPDVLIFAGEALPDVAETQSRTTADAVWMSDAGPGGSNSVIRIYLGDVDGDGVLDLVHTYSGSSQDIAYHAGTVQGFFETSVTDLLSGTKEDTGSCIVTFDDVNGDGSSDIIACENGAAEQPGALGGIVLLSTQANAEPVQLQSGGLTAASGIGTSVSATDLNGDGHDEIIVGAPIGYGGPPIVTQSGVAYVLESQDGAVENEPVTTLTGPNHQHWSRFGSSVKAAGDFDGDGHIDLLVTNPDEDKPSQNQWPGWPLDYDPDGVAACDEGETTRTGAVKIYRGSADQTLDPEPSAVIYPSTYWPSYSMLDLVPFITVSGDFDFDGDGFDDIAMGRPRHPSIDGSELGGEIALYRGGQLSDQTQVICEADAVFQAGGSTWLLGQAITPLADLDGDGCDELAVSAPGSVTGTVYPDIPWDGRVYILYGFGPNCTSISPRVAALHVPFPMSGFGFSLDGSADIDGDGERDLIVSAPFFLVGTVRYGAIAVIDGVDLGNAASELLDDNVLGAVASPTTLPLTFTSPNFLLSPVTGSNNINPVFTLPTNGSYEDIPLFGHRVRFVHGIGEHDVGVAVGIPNYRTSPTHDSGHVRTYGWTDALNAKNTHLSTHGIFVGQTWKPGSRLGQTIAGGSWNGEHWLVVGAPGGDPLNVPDQVDNGSVYVLPLLD